VTPELEDKIARLPTRPGVYLMRGPKGEIVYIGKATNLRSRVRSYFTGHDPRQFVRFLGELLTDIDVMISQNPKEALLLENTLIKKHRPRFNFMLKDDKNYLSIRVDLEHEWPRVELVRQISKDGARYFGPYHSAQNVRKTLNVLNRYFQLRTCPDTILNNRSRPCLQHQIKRCPAPCVLDISRDAYMDDVGHALLFLQGKQVELTEELVTQMMRAAEHMEFERAAHLRDQIKAIESSLTQQSAVQTTLADQDVIGICRQGENVAVAVLMFRGGSLMDVSNYALHDQLFPDEDLLNSFIAQFYQLSGNNPPETIYCPTEPNEQETIASYLSDVRGTKVSIHVPRRGEKRDLLDLAIDNATNYFQETLSSTARSMAALEKLQSRLRLRQIPRTMECYDISNFQGKQIVASGVRFLDGDADRANYRRYRIRTTQTQDDFQSMFEVLTRRAKASMDGSFPMPDLLVIDGGKGQLSMAVQALQDLGMHDQEIVSLAKSRVEGTDDNDAPQYSAERVFVPGHKEPIVLKQNSDEMYLLTRIRDEAHRVAITYHRDLRKKETLRSRLDDIEGVGPSKRAALLKHFGSVKGVREATLAELEAAPTVGRRLAATVFSFFHPDELDAFSDVVESIDDIPADGGPVIDLHADESNGPAPAENQSAAASPPMRSTRNERDLARQLGTTRVIAAGRRRSGGGRGK
jgi:excinuclease ABC subunit C